MIPLPRHINVLGHIAGSSQVVDEDGVPAEEHAILWNGSTMRDLGAPGGISSEAEALNDADQVTGVIYLGGAIRARVFVGRRDNAGYPPARCLFQYQSGH